LKALHRRVGSATVHVTHDQVEALVLGDRIAVLRDGRLEQVGTPDEIWHAPATTFVARFVGAPRMNLLPGDGPLRRPDAVPDAGRTLGLRPEAVHLSGSAETRGHVERVDVVGADAYAYVRVDGHRVVSRVTAADRPAVGDEVGVSVSWDACHVFDAASGLRVAQS
jgi:multiple sugar transport system ATP-binding protein